MQYEPLDLDPYKKGTAAQITQHSNSHLRLRPLYLADRVCSGYRTALMDPCYDLVSWPNARKNKISSIV